MERKKSEWFAWNNMFLVRAMTRGYYEILMGEEQLRQIKRQG